MARLGKQDSAIFWLDKASLYDLKLNSWKKPSQFFIDSADFKVQKTLLNAVKSDDMLPVQLNGNVYWLTNRRWSGKRQKINSYNKQVYPFVVYTDLGQFQYSNPKTNISGYDTMYKPVLKALNFSNLIDTRPLQNSVMSKEGSASGAIKRLKPIQGLPRLKHLKKEYSFISAINASVDGQLILVHTQVNIKNNTFIHRLYEVAKIKNEEFKVIAQLPFIDSTSLSVHAAIDPTARFLVISKQNADGNHDMYYSKRSDSLHWGPLHPFNNTNTEGDEIFPVFDNKGNLFFSSNGLPGMGGWDIYRLDASSWLTHQPEHLSYPVNTSANEFGWAWLKNDSLALFTSDRLGKDELFKVSIENLTRPVVVLIDSPLSYSKAIKSWVIEDTLTSKNVDWVEERVDGLLEANVKNNHTYRIKYVFDDGSDTSFLFFTPELGKELPVLHLNAPKKFLPVRNQDSVIGLADKYNSDILGTESGLLLKQVYFDFDSDHLTLAARKMLDSISVLVKLDSALYLSIAGFTDCIGNDRYNKKLSFKRQKSVVDYLLKKGVSRKQLHSSFYGSNYQRFKCTTQKTSSSNKLNRRVEMFIGKKKGKQWLDYWSNDDNNAKKSFNSNVSVVSMPSSVLHRNNYSDTPLTNNESNWREKLLINAYLKRTNDLSPIYIPVFGDSIELEIYDNGNYDRDTISIIINKRLEVNCKELSTIEPIKFKLAVSDSMDIVLNFIANSIGDEEPNSALLIINDVKQRRVEVPVMSDLRRNRKVVIRKEKIVSSGRN